MNNIKKGLVIVAVHYENQIASNQSTLYIIIRHIDSNHYKRYCF